MVNVLVHMVRDDFAVTPAVNFSVEFGQTSRWPFLLRGFAVHSRRGLIRVFGETMPFEARFRARLGRSPGYWCFW